MAEFVARLGLIALNNSTVSGSLTVTNGITGSLFGTASWSTNALTSSFVPGYISGSGTTNYVSKFTAGGVIGLSQIFDDGTRVGIGTTSPTDTYSIGKALDVYGSNGAALYMRYATDPTVQFGAVSYDRTGLGLYLVTNNALPITFATSASEKMRITSGGNVGIGTTSPTIYSGWTGVDIRGANGGHLIVGNTAATNRGEIFTDGNGFNISAQTNNALIIKTNDAERMRITSAGNVGIGTTSPNAKLEVSGNLYLSNNTSILAIGNNTALNPYLQGDASNNLYIGTSGSARITVLTSGNVGIGTTSPSSKLHVTAGTQALNAKATIIDADIETNTSVYTSTLHLTNNTVASGSAALTFGNYSHGIIKSRTNGGDASGIGGALDFYTRPTNSNPPSVKMTIDNAGNVGIGTTNPGRQLEIYNANDAYIKFNGQRSGNRAYTIGNDIGGFIIYDDTSSAYRMVISGSTGNVGIGTTTPNAKLDVNGNTIITGSLIVTQGITGSLQGTSSWANNAITASNALTASYVLNAVSASFASTASNILGGASNYVPLWNGATTLSSSAIYQSSGNVGIGTTSIEAPLHIIKTGGSTGSINVGLIVDYEATAAEQTGAGTAIQFRGKSGGGNIANYNQAQIATNNWGNNNSHGLSFFYKPNAAGTLTEGFRLNWNGNVGIGTDSPSDKLGIVVNTDAASGINISNQNTGSSARTRIALETQGGNWYIDGIRTSGEFAITRASTEIIRINSSGNVGIGTTSPSTALHIARAAASAPAIRLQTTNSTANGSIQWANSANSIIAIIGSNYNVSDGEGGLEFATGGTTTRMFISSSGNVGIGTTSPGAKLDVAYSTNPTTETPHILLRTGGTVKQAAITAESNQVSGLVFSTGDGTLVDRMVILRTNGNVGIGTTTPNAKLDVSGSAIVSGSLTVTDTITAQRIVVQTITSSVDFVTGSTRFGSVISNTHTFTGSVAITGSLTVVGAGITSSLFGTSSWATNALSSSYILSAVSASFASTASNILGGTANYIPLFNTATTLSSSVMFQSASNIGIGTTSPLASLQIATGNFALSNLSSLITGSIPSTGTQKLILGGNSSNGVGNEIGWYPNNSFQGDIAQITAIATAFGSSAAGALLFRTNTNTEATPSEKMRITAAGNVGIGTTSPATSLQVNGTTRATRINSTGGVVDFDAQTGNNFIQVASSNMSFANNGAVNAYISSSGNVGIGTTSPSQKLEINSTGTDNFIKYTTTSTGTTGTDGLLIGIANSNETYILNYESSPIKIFTAGSERMRIDASGNVGIGTTSPSAPLMFGKAVYGAPSSEDFYRIKFEDVGGIHNDVGIGQPAAGALAFNCVASTGYISFNEGTNNERVRITGGNVGIGTTSPAGKLHIKQIASEIPLILDNSNGTSGSFTQYRVNASTGWEVGMAGSGDSYKWFFSYGTFSSTNSKFTITNTGDIGVGTIAPQYKLHVVGGHVKLPNNYKLYFGDVAEALGFSIGSDGASNNMAITNNNNATLQIGTGGTSGHIRFTPNSAESVRFTGTGDVGIGTTSPAAKLQVNGNTIISGSLNVTGSVTAPSFVGTASFAVSASWAPNTGGGGVTINNNTDNYLITATGTANTLNGEANLQFNGSALTVTGSFTVITGSAIELLVTNTGVNIGSALNDTHVISGSLNMPHTGSGVIKLQDASVWANSANYTHPQIRLPDYRTGITLLNNDEIQFVTDATAPMGLKLSAGIPKVTLDSTTWLQWSSAATNGFTHDIILKRESAAVLALTGSLKSSGGFTGSLQGTSSWAVSASWAPSAGGSAPTAVTFNRVTASYTFALTDAGKTVEVSASAAGTYNLTVPPASTTNFADGTFIDVVLYGTGSIQFVTGSGVTFRSANNWTKLGTRYGAATIINIAGDEWYLIGNLNA